MKRSKGCGSEQIVSARGNGLGPTSDHVAAHDFVSAAGLVEAGCALSTADAGEFEREAV